MKTFLALAFSLSLCISAQSAENDTLVFEQTINIGKLSPAIVQERVLNWLAFKCESWNQVIHIKRTGSYLGTYYFKYETAADCPVPLSFVPRILNTLEISIHPGHVDLKIISSGGNENCTPSMVEPQRIFQEVVRVIIED